VPTVEQLTSCHMSDNLVNSFIIWHPWQKP